jgi:hypothetical protein
VGTRKGGVRMFIVDVFCIQNTKYFIFCRRVKPVEIVLRRGKRGRRTMEGVNPTKIHFKDICKCHNVSPCTTIIC